MSWRVIGLQHPIVCNVPSDSLDPFSKSCQDIFVEGVCPGGTNSLCTMPRLTKKNNNHGFQPGSAHAYFLRTRGIFRVSFLTLPFWSRDRSRTPTIHLLLLLYAKKRLNFESSQQILTNSQPVRFLLHRQVFRHQFCTNFSHVQMFC